MSQRKLTPNEAQALQEALNSYRKNGYIRLREGEYQYHLAKAIASFQLELHFPDVKDIIKKLYGEEKASDIQFIRKIQTILKKMEKSNIVKILPKKKPWDLQRYALTSFKFQDIEKNLVTFATDSEMKQAQEMLSSALIQQEVPTAKLNIVKICLLALVISASYIASVWTLMQPIIDPIIFVIAFFVAVACSLMLGKVLSHT